MNLDSISRRQLLAGVIGSGAASLVGLASLAERSRAYPNTMQLQTGEIDGLVLDWRETYNGATLTGTTAGTTTVSPSGPVISLGNVLPGDSGSLSVRLRIDAEAVDDPQDVSIEPELTFSLTDDLRSPGIQEFIDAAVWYDTGLFGLSALGAHNAVRDLGERLVHPGAVGTLEDVGDALNDGIVLDSLPNVPGTGCLGVDDTITITFGWSFPPNQANINAVQGDMVEFDLRFDASKC